MTTTYTGPPIVDLTTEAGRTYAKRLVKSIRSFHKLSNAAKASLLDTIATFDALDLATHFGAASTGSWLIREMHYSSSTAYEYVHVACELRNYPLLFSAFRKGEIDYTSVRFILKYIRPETEAHLVDMGKKYPFKELKRALAGTEPNDTTRKPDEPHFTIWDRDTDDMLAGNFLLPPVIGQFLKAALKIADLAAHGHTHPDTTQLKTLLTQLTTTQNNSEDNSANEPTSEPGATDTPTDASGMPGHYDRDDQDAGYSEDDHPYTTDEDTNTDHDDEEILDPEGDPADFGDVEFSFDDVDPDGVEEVNPGVMITPPRKPTTMPPGSVLRIPSRFGDTPKQNLYAAFVTMINIVRSQPITAAKAPGADVSIIVTEDGRAWMPHNPQVPSSALVGYVNNALARAHLLSTNGVTLHYGRKRRLASDAQIKALQEVWGNQCAIPGCARSNYMQIHHIHDWADGGKTDIDNLIPLCSSCHSLVSHGITRITQLGDDLLFRFKTGAEYVSPNRSIPQQCA